MHQICHCRSECVCWWFVNVFVDVVTAWWTWFHVFTNFLDHLFMKCETWSNIKRLFKIVTFFLPLLITSHGIGVVCSRLVGVMATLPPDNDSDLKHYKCIDKIHLLLKTHEWMWTHVCTRPNNECTITMLNEMDRDRRDLFEGMGVNKTDSPFQIGKEKFSCVRLNFSRG